MRLTIIDTTTDTTTTRAIAAEAYEKLRVEGVAELTAPPGDDKRYVVSAFTHEHIVLALEWAAPVAHTIRRTVQLTDAQIKALPPYWRE